MKNEETPGILPAKSLSESPERQDSPPVAHVAPRLRFLPPDSPLRQQGTVAGIPCWRSGLE